MKKKYALLLGLFLLGALYNAWTLRPVNILYVYSDAGSTMSIAVDHLPLTDKEKIDWYMARRDQLKEDYSLYNNVTHRYYIIDISDGFTNYDEMPKEDLRCFPDIKNDKNCLVKYYLLIVNEGTDGKVIFHIPDEQFEYQLTEEGKIEVVPPPSGWR